VTRTSKLRNPERVPIGALKARLSEYLARARAGEEVVITDRGRPVARLAPLEGSAARDARGRALVHAGLAKAPSERLDPSWLAVPRPKDAAGRSLEAVLEERAEDR
jgi:prevent-host-death family protein